jgi:diguanylate cyclase (GGDEF) domain
MYVFIVKPHPFVKINIIATTSLPETCKPWFNRKSYVVPRSIFLNLIRSWRPGPNKAHIAVAKCLRNNIKRETDFVARFGGEEFVCVLPFVEKIEGFEFAKTMVQSVEDMKMPHPMNLCSKYLTISAGMASTVPDGNNSHIQLLDEADKALYSAKASGRNRVVMN